MSRRRFAALSTASLVAVLATLLFATGANAAIHSLRVYVYPHGYQSPARVVYIDFDGVDSTLDMKITARRPGVVAPIHEETDSGFGGGRYSTYGFTLLEPGDVVEIRQPAAAVNPTASFQTPTAALNFSGTSVSGSIGAGLINSVSTEGTCLTEQRYVSLPATGGPFSADLGRDMAPGTTARVRSFNSVGFEFGLTDRVPGERGCVRTQAVPTDYGVNNPGRKDPTPYAISVDELSHQIPTVRVVLRRAGAILEDRSFNSTTFASFSTATAPQPGDLVEIYRPKTAAAPTQVETVPQVSGVFDPANDQAALTTPAGRETSVSACHPLVCDGSGRALLDTAAGRHFFDFTKPESNNAAFDLQLDSTVTGRFQSATEPIEHRFALSLGDLAAPTQSLKFPGKLKLKTLIKSFKKGYKVKLTSSELAVAKLALTLPKATKSAKAKPKPKPTTIALASATRTVGAQTTTIKLKFTKSGKKALRKLARSLSKKGSRSAILTSTLTDPSGNVTTTVKQTKLKR